MSHYHRCRRRGPKSARKMLSFCKKKLNLLDWCARRRATRLLRMPQAWYCTVRLYFLHCKIQNLVTAYDNVTRSFNKPNVLVTGITGSGKSTLINAMFGKEVAATGSGVPITQHFTYVGHDFVTNFLKQV